MLVQVYPGRARLCVRTSRLIQRSLLEPQLCDSQKSRDHQETIDRHIAAKNGRLRQTLAPREPELTPLAGGRAPNLCCRRDGGNCRAAGFRGRWRSDTGYKEALCPVSAS